MTNDIEIWNDLLEYPGYMISNHGRVRGKRGVLKPVITRGRYRYKVRKDNLSHYLNISRYVYQYFIGVLIDNLVIDHIDHDPSNNHYKNLQQITHRENTSKDKWRKNGTSNYPGVSINNSNPNKPWRARIHINGVNKHLGTFATEEEAIEIRKKALKSCQ